MSIRPDTAARFLDQTGSAPAALKLWPSVVVPKEALDAEIERLVALPAPADGRRRSLIVHPHAESPGLGLAPGITVALEVLLPGEETAPIRHNSSVVSFCIAGGGETSVDGRTFRFGVHDVLSIPSMATYVHRNSTAELQVRLAYSNAALLEKLHVHLVDNAPATDEWVLDDDELRSAGDRPTPGDERDEPTASSVGDTFPLGDGGALLMSYERLINPPLIDSQPVHWPWPAVRGELDRLVALGPDYRGRRLFLLYNPATGRTNGTTLSFFATMTVRPPGIVDRPHRHVAAAINYFFSGSGYSRVGGRRYEWKSGDLMLSAPGWEVHHHASNDEPVYELTIQDSPAHLAIDSLLWQEDLKRPPRLLGSHTGFDTNRSTIVRGAR